MKRRLFPLVLAAVGALLVSPLAAAQEQRALAHNSFSLPKPLLAQFEAQAGVKSGLALPKSLDDLTQPQYRDLLATIAALREPASLDSLSAETIAENGAERVSRWTKVVLK